MALGDSLSWININNRVSTETSPSRITMRVGRMIKGRKIRRG